ncbi:MAG: polymorphic toxin type 17 domain-containing protein, partial [Nonlabens sp.]
TEYAGGFIYEQGMLQMMPHAEGYAEIHNGSWRYVYQYKDHLGNIRLSYSDTNNDGSVNSSEILSEKHYYPFGGIQKGYSIASSESATASKFGYNGKEDNPELGLEWMDYGARFYDPAVGRWFTPDAMAEKYYDQSIYNYTINNPILFVDPDGNQVKMCCEGLIKYAKAAYKGIKNEVSSRGTAVVQLVTNPVGTFNAMVDNTPSNVGEAAEQVVRTEMDNSTIGSLVLTAEAAYNGYQENGAEGAVEAVSERTTGEGIDMAMDMAGGVGGKATGTGFKVVTKAIIRSSKGLLKKAKLPNLGKIRFVPRAADLKNGKLLRQDGGYIDKFGNVWKKGPSRTEGQDFEWDVQLSKKGKEQLGHLSSDGEHLNISLDGKVTH